MYGRSVANLNCKIELIGLTLAPWFWCGVHLIDRTCSTWVHRTGVYWVYGLHLHIVHRVRVLFLFFSGNVDIWCHMKRWDLEFICKFYKKGIHILEDIESQVGLIMLEISIQHLHVSFSLWKVYLSTFGFQGLGFRFWSFLDVYIFLGGIHTSYYSLAIGLFVYSFFCPLKICTLDD